LSISSTFPLIFHDLLSAMQPRYYAEIEMKEINGAQQSLRFLNLLNVGFFKHLSSFKTYRTKVWRQW